MGGDPFFFQHRKDNAGHFIVDHPFTANAAFDLTVKSGGVVFILNDKFVGIVGFKNFFGFTFIQLF
jgi:hypothetical protein